MKITAQAHTLSHQVLYRQLSLCDFVEILDPASEHECKAVRIAVLKNVLSGRVTGLLSAKKPPGIDLWLRDYVRRVHACFAAERARWQRLLTTPSTALIDGRDAPGDPLIDEVNAATRRVFRAVCERHRGECVEFDELVHATYLWMRDGELLNYSFDVPLNAWLSGRVEACAEQMFAHTRRWIPLSDAFSASGDPFYCGGGDNADIDALIDAVSRLIANDQRLISDYLAGVDIAVTARALGIAASTAYTRRQRVLRQLRAALADPDT